MSLKEQYTKEMKKKLMEELKIQNPMAVPRILKVVLNVGAGEAVTNKNAIEKIQEQMTLIAGQKAVVTKARKSVSAFKIRQGQAIGVKVTLRGNQMFAFLEKLVSIVIPRLRDFRGIEPSTVDQNGNLNLGFTEQTIFPEIEFDKVDKIRGLQVTVVTNARSREYGTKLFTLLGVPFKK